MIPLSDEFDGYVVDATLGRGGYATVYRAHRVADPNHDVALKVLDDHHRREDQTARLRREFEFAYQLSHPHVITVYEYGGAWLAMELVDGGTATALAEQGDRAGGTGSDRRRARLHTSMWNRARGRQAIEYSCLSGLYPRGIDRLRCRAHGRRDSLAASDSLETSLPYTAPELLRGRPPSALTDAYALACTAVELLLGAPPFAADTPMALVDAHLSHPVPSFSRKIAWVPRAFDTVMARALAKIPESRYDSCLELVAQPHPCAGVTPEAIASRPAASRVGRGPRHPSAPGA